MPHRLAHESPPETRVPFGAGLAVAFAAAIAAPFDRLLRGMVASGLGIEALCLYLGLTRDALHDSVVRLGLPTPHDCKMRQASARGWSVADKMRLIAWRVAGIHPADIGQRLGGRTASAVRAACRRLGVFAPDRKSLRRVDPATLIDPLPGLETFAPPAEPARRPAATLSDRCGTAAGDLIVRRRRRTRAAPADAGASYESLFVGSYAVEPTQPAPPPTSWHEPPLGEDAPSPHDPIQSFDVAPPAPETHAAQAAPHLIATAEPDLFPAVSPPPSKAGGALGWISRVKNRRRNRDVAMALALRYFGGQIPTAIAADAGITHSALQSYFCHLEMPRDRHRSKFGDGYDEEVAKQRFERSGYELAICPKTGFLFFRKKRERATVRFCRQVRKSLGLIWEFDRYRGAEICL